MQLLNLLMRKSRGKQEEGKREQEAGRKQLGGGRRKKEGSVKAWIGSSPDHVLSPFRLRASHEKKKFICKIAVNAVACYLKDVFVLGFLLNRLSVQAY